MYCNSPSIPCIPVEELGEVVKGVAGTDVASSLLQRPQSQRSGGDGWYQLKN